jgi:hypothetical protein
VSDPAKIEVLPEGLGPPPKTGVLGTLVVTALLTTAGVGALLWGRERLVRRGVSVEESWLSTGLDGAPAEAFRSGPGEMYFHARLDGVPLGERVEIECEWLDPQGVTRRHNQYQTRVVDVVPWTTHCRCSLGDAPAGRWRVRMTLEGRELSAAAFRVEAP